MSDQALAVLEMLAINGPMSTELLGAWLCVPTEEIYPSLVQLTDANRIRMIDCRKTRYRKRLWISENA